MARSAGLALYLASRSLARRGKGKPDQDLAPSPPRPEGELIWFAAGPGTRPDALSELARRTLAARPGSSALVTSEDDFTASSPLIADATPADTSREVRRFLDHWRPDIAILGGEVSYPTIVVEAHDRGIPVCLVDARIPQSAARKLRWAPMAGASLFQRVSHILAPNEADADTFRRLGVPADRVEAKGLLAEASAPLPCNFRDHAALAALLAARPVWFANAVQEDEIEHVLMAHDRARRVAHRLLLILSPSNPESGGRMKAMLETQGWKTALRSEGEEPDPDVQIYVVDQPGEDGLWYRLAPITFLGSSLGEGGGHDPYEPAALGSAILSGRRTGAYRDAFSRFLAAGAARSVGTGDALGEAVADLLSPDRAADMACRAWEITSEGAEVTDLALEIILEALEQRESAR
jgi:3-deoxy-D-manno-octulosonic-acid transferase